MGSEMGDSFKEHRQEMKERKEKEGIDCPGCKIKEPKRVPSRLLPGWTCKVCGHKRLSMVNDSGKMKITLSKSQWEDAGRKAGWITAQKSNTSICPGCGSKNIYMKDGRGVCPDCKREYELKGVTTVVK